MRWMTRWSLLLVVGLALGCGDDAETSDEPDAAGTSDATEDAAADAGADTGDDAAPDTAPDSVDEDGTTGEDAVVIEGLRCGASTETTATVAPGEGATLQLALEGAELALSAQFLGREVLAPRAMALRCSDERLVPEGVVALGPSFSISSDDAAQFTRRYFVSLPFETALLPEGARASSIQVYFRPEGSDAVRTPMVINLQENLFRGTIRFETELQGTFQLGVPESAGTPREREWQFRAVTGVSMGAMGSSMLAARNPDAFDIVAPLGGPAEWTYLLHYIRDGGMGGFAPAPTFGPAPPFTVTEEYEHPMTFDNWYFPTGEGTGGTFDRGSYIEIFLDLALSIGNFATYSDVSPYRAPGLPLSETLRAPRDRCPPADQCPPADPASTFTIASGFYDNEYNPDGSLPVIQFCDGEGSRDASIPFDRACDLDFNGRPDETNRGLYQEACGQPRPVDISYAVDVNGNGVRDPGEPVIRNFFEPFEDVGPDGLASVDEPGFDPVTAPDPAGDDYDPVSNPFGAEGNWMYDDGEPYEDVGLDGVADTPSLAEGGYDFGEGNGQFDYNPNVINALENYSPRALLAAMPAEQRAGLTWFMDAGIRDLFNFGVGANQLAGTMQGLGMNVRVYDQFYSVQDLAIEDADDYDFTEVDYASVGDHVYVRYGSLDANEEDICFGDGKHVGTVSQLANRLLTMLGFVTNRFPDGETTQIASPFPLPSGTYYAPTPTTGGRMKYSIAFPPGYERTACSDGIDNDGDGRVDGDDSACESASGLSESGEAVDYCSDGLDNDQDGLADEEDPECIGGDGLSEWPADSVFRNARFPVVYLLHGYGQSPEDLQVAALPFSTFMAQGIWPKVILVFPDGYCGDIEVTACTDGVDNDDDGFTDADDEGCAASGGRSETGERVAYCADGVDNDRDGLADAEDGGCRADDWDSEANCVQGNFYIDHVAYGDGEPGGPAYEDIFFDLVSYVDATYRTRPAETFPDVQ